MTLDVRWKDCAVDDAQKETFGFAVGVCMMITGMHALRDIGDVREIVWRVRFYERINQPIIVDGTGKGISGTREFWEPWLTVSINGAQETRAKYVKRMVENMCSEITYGMRDD